MLKKNNSLIILSKSAGIAIIGVFISKLLTYLFRIIIARSKTVGIEGYGMFSLAVAIFGFLSLLSVWGTDQGILRYIPQYRVQNKQREIVQCVRGVLLFSVILALILTSITFFLSNALSKIIFNKEGLSPLLKVMVLIVPFDVANRLLFSAFRSYKEVKYEVIIHNILENALKLFVIIILLYLGMGVIATALAYFFASVGSFIVALIYFRKKHPGILPSRVLPIEIPWHIIRFSTPLTLTATLSFFIGWTDTFMIGVLLKDFGKVGIYNAALPTALILYMFAYAFFIVLLPLLTEHYAKRDKLNFDITYKAATKWVLFFLGFLTLLFIILPADILQVLFGEEYILGAPVLAIISTGYFINFTLRGAEHVLIVLKKQNWLFWNMLSAVILNILLNFFMIKTYGIIGAAIATAVSYIVLAFASLFESYLLVKLWPFKISYIKILIAGIIAILPIKLVRVYNLLAVNKYLIVILIMLSGIMYIGLLMLFKTFNTNDKEIYEIVKQKLPYFKS